MRQEGEQVTTCYITDAIRSPVGALGGTLASKPAFALAGELIRHWQSFGVLDSDSVDQVILGNVLQSGQGMNPARQAAVLGGLPYTVPAYTVNAVCASGLQSIVLGAQAIKLGEAQTIVAGGMENMSRTPHALLGSRSGKRLGHEELTDLMILDGLWDAFYSCHMASTVESLARRMGITRDEQDKLAVCSHERAVEARQSGTLETEIVPIETDSGCVSQDERPRADTTFEKLAGLEPAFANDGTITAGNASGINDGAAILKLTADRPHGDMRLCFEVVSSELVAVDPGDMGIAPVYAIRKLLSRLDLRIEDIGLWEINEAFAAQIIAVQRQLEVSWDRLNVKGGAVAIGHPVGCSGARILVSLVHEMLRRNTEHGVASVCVGGGLGLALLVRQL